MRYRLINKEKHIDGEIDVDCSVKVMEGLINTFKEFRGVEQTLPNFVRWINSDTSYVAELQDNPVLFDF